MRTMTIDIDDICGDCVVCSKKKDRICYECATTIEKQLLLLKGVKGADADHKKKIVTIQYNEKQTSSTAIKRNIRETIERFELPA